MMQRSQLEDPQVCPALLIPWTPMLMNASEHSTSTWPYIYRVPGSVSVSPVFSPLAVCECDGVEPDAHRHHENTFPTLFPQEEWELEIARGAPPRPARSDEPYRRALIPQMT